MTYKIKSLIYFVCFLIAVIAYDNFDSANSIDTANNQEIAALSIDQTPIEKDNRIK